MIDLNVKAIVSLCHMFERDMVAGSDRRPLVVSFTAAHMSGSLQTTYFVTEAHVSDFSRALAEELRGKA